MMAPVELPNTRALAAWPNALAGVFTFLVFVALRLLDGDAQKGVLVVSAVLYGVMIFGRIRGRLAADAAGKRLLLLVGGPADTLLLVGAGLAVWHELGTDVHELVLAAGILALLAGAGLTLALEIAEAPMRANAVIDNRRIESAARTAGTLLAALTGLVGLVYAVDKLDVRHDFSFAAPTSPSQATLSLLDAAACGDEKGKPEVYLFFERGSPALGEVRDYFDALEHKGARVITQDSALDPALAKSMKVSRNGTVGLKCGERSETYVVGDDRDGAQKKLNKLDEEIRTKLAKISKDAVTVYATVGHGERSLEDNAKSGERVSARNLKRLVESLNGKSKKLGLADGLSKEVPADAALVIVMGPTAPFLPEEAHALAAYVERGGSLLLLLDPPVPGGDRVGGDVVSSLEPLLAKLGVTVGTHEVLNDKAYVKESNSNADHAFLFSTSFGSHKSVKTLSGARGRAALLFKQVANVDKRNKSEDKDGPKVSLLTRTAAASWIDINDDRRHDEGAEARAIYDLAGAVELKGGDKEGRAIVVGDSDVLADFLLVNSEANQVFGYELLLWLLRDDDKISAGGVESPEDVRIMHTRDEDKLWFYGTVFLLPAVLMTIGFVLVKRRRARPRKDVGQRGAA